MSTDVHVFSSLPNSALSIAVVLVNRDRPHMSPYNKSQNPWTRSRCTTVSVPSFVEKLSSPQVAGHIKKQIITANLIRKHCTYTCASYCKWTALKLGFCMSHADVGHLHEDEDQ